MFLYEVTICEHRKMWTRYSQLILNNIETRIQNSYKILNTKTAKGLFSQFKCHCSYVV